METIETSSRHKLFWEIIEGENVHTVFQPIVDFYTGKIWGYEALSRGMGNLTCPHALFNQARIEGALWDLERTCRKRALQTIASLPNTISSSRFFINVSPDILSDERFVHGFTRETLQQLGLNHKNIVIEITEESNSLDHHRLEKLVYHYSSQGFSIALDDFGRGQSSLMTLIASTPHYLKLDREIINAIHEDEYKQHLVKSITTFASSVESRIIAEGVEDWADCKTLLRLGVRFFQGFLISKPVTTPPELSAEFRATALDLIHDFNYPLISKEETISRLVTSVKTIEGKDMTCDDIDRIFKKNLGLDHLVVTDKTKITGLITRQHYYLTTGGPFGYHLFQHRNAEKIMKSNPLIVEERMPITSLARIAMERSTQNVYDPVIVVDAQGQFLGSVTVRQLLTRASELEIKKALGSNPLTNLPGNRAIQKWIEDAIMNEEYSIIYADLDNFKEFNDVFGFLMGDELLRMTAKVLIDNRLLLANDANVGHIGGDDFIIVAQSLINEDVLHDICRQFDVKKRDFFREEDKTRGYYRTYNREGNLVDIPLVTLSLAVLKSPNFHNQPHPAFLAQVAANLKKQVKRETKSSKLSNFLIERRFYGKKLIQNA